MKNIKILIIAVSILSSVNMYAMQKSGGNGNTRAGVSVGAQSASVGASRNVGRGSVNARATANYNGSGSASVGANVRTSRNSSVGIRGTAGSWGGKYATISGNLNFRAISREMILEELCLGLED